MKTTTRQILIGLALAGSLSGPLAPAQGALNLSAFKGNYRGTMSLRDPDGAVSRGRATLALAVPRSGKSARLRYRATIPDGEGGSDAFPTAMILSANKRASVTDLLVGIAGTNNAKPGRGRWSQRQRTLRINASNGEGISLRGIATVRDIGKRRTLNLKLTSTDPGGSYLFSNRLVSRVP